MPIAKTFRVALLALLCVSSARAAESARPPVSQEKFNRMIEIMKKMYHRIDELEAKLRAQAPGGESAGTSQRELEELRQRVAELEGKAQGKPAAAPAAEGAVNLDEMDSSPAPSSPHHRAAKDSPLPLLKVYFDLNFYSMPGGPAQGSGLTFDNFHSFVMVDVNPTPDISFSTIIETTPHYYELDYSLADWLMLRMGKIWVPFDDMSPHNLFGGMTNVSRIWVGEAFLPDLFTDLGVGLRAKVFDSEGFALKADGYVVNGFQSGGTDPVTAGSLYPNFASLPTGADNNRDKALGGRVHALIGRTLGLGGSVYSGRWTNKDSPNRRLMMIGIDSQLYLGTFSVRAGLASMNVQLPPSSPNGSYHRGGYYGELAQKFGAADNWTFLVRGGALNGDNRIVDRNDKEIVGVKLMWKPNLLEWSIEHSRDLRANPAKGNRSFTNFRVVASF